MKKDLKKIADKALAEAEARNRTKKKTIKVREVNGPEGPEPTRYGDWEKKGIVSDF